MNVKNMKMEEDDVKDNYQLKGLPRKNPYAKKIKEKGYSVSIHYDTPEDMQSDNAVDTIKSILERPGLNSIHLYIKNPS